MSSPLLRLPAELRILIFEYCLGFPWIVIFERLAYIHDWSWTVGAFACDNFRALVGPTRHMGDLTLRRHQNFLGLLQICRQTYHEAHPILFQSKTFVLSSESALYAFSTWVWDRNFTYGVVQGSNRPHPEAINAIAVPNCISSIQAGSNLRILVETAFPNLKKIYVYNKQSELDVNADAFYREWMQESGGFQFVFL